jgi:type III pantothenate kinase
MLLAVDAGNTNIKFGVFDGDHLLVQWRIRTHPGRTSDEYAALLSTLFAEKQLRFEQIDGVAIASSAPAATPDIERLSQSTFNIKPLKVNASLDLGVTVTYEPPTDVGPDRLADAAAAVHKYGNGPLIFIDFGTGTTFNAVAGGGTYLGGAICPGIALSWNALFERASKLSRVEMEQPDGAVGRSTRHALQSGMLYGLVTMVDGMVEMFRTELSAPDCSVIATGGNLTEVLVKTSSTITHTDPTLTLDGLRIIHDRNRQSR